MDNQSGESWLMPIKVQWCVINISDSKSKKELLKWLDKYDPCNAPHRAVYTNRRVKKFSSSNEIYINHIGIVREADYLVAYWNPCYCMYFIEQSSYKSLPLFTADKIDSYLYGYFYDEKYQEALKVIKERVVADTKAHKEFEKSQRKKK